MTENSNSESESVIIFMAAMIENLKKVKTNCLLDNEKLMSEWNYVKNDNLNIDVRNIKNKKIKVWWKCEKGHEWQAGINMRLNGNNCPYCANKKVFEGFNDILTTDPEVAEEWNYERNGELMPTDVVRGSAKKVWWKCEKGHEWQTVVYSRTKENKGCPYCCNQKILSGYNDLATNNPKLAKEWNYEKNSALKPEQVAPRTNKKVWWRCEKGHEWQAGISDRQRGDGCPVCCGRKVLKGYNDLAALNPQLAKEWNYEKNETLTPENVTCNSGKKVWWKCEKGHEWQAQIASRNWGNGCPKCANEAQTSFPEKVVFYYISKSFPDAVENYKPDWLRPMELDIFIPSINVAIEYDGRNWHKDSKNDNKKNKLCKKNGILLYRLREEGCFEVDDNSINFILKNIKSDGSQVIDGIKWLAKELNAKIDVDLTRDYRDINELIHYSHKKNALSSPQLLQEWNYVKNGNLTPEKVTNNSGKKVWWRCELGHEWQAQINDRQRGDGCPYCSGQRVLKGFNDIFTTHSYLITEWDFEKNIGVNPEKLSKGSSKSVWWKCKNGHNYQSAIGTRTSGSGCPICDGKVIKPGYNDLVTKNPQLAKEWNYEKNGELTPDQVAPYTNKKVWWRCKKGHEWNALVSSRSNNSNCPYCCNQKILSGYNDLATRNPELVKDWDYANNMLEPNQVMASNKTKIYWVCHMCGYKFEKSIFNRVRSPKCPKCRM